MNVGPAWQRGYTGKGVVVSILDDGIQTNHPDLALNYVSYRIFNGSFYRRQFSEMKIIFTRGECYAGNFCSERIDV